MTYPIQVTVLKGGTMEEIPQAPTTQVFDFEDGTGIQKGRKSGKSLFSKNVKIGSKRTSVRLEPQMWQALNEIATMEKCTIHQLCTAVSELKKPMMPFTAALRVFLMEYYRSVARVSPDVSEIRKMIQGTPR